jgi:hypothetical protein
MENLGNEVKGVLAEFLKEPETKFIVWVCVIIGLVVPGYIFIFVFWDAVFKSVNAITLGLFSLALSLPFYFWFAFLSFIFLSRELSEFKSDFKLYLTAGTFFSLIFVFLSLLSRRFFFKASGYVSQSLWGH